ncbi:MAG TPA: single-stranded-DNA-specific exonuclease RecJ [Verrucomicrobiae bacterium]
MKSYRWSFAPVQLELARVLSQGLKVSPLLAQCLLNREISEEAAAAEFLDPKLKNLRDPFLLPDMAKAVERLYSARKQGELVVIFGDYDVDGVTSTTLLSESLTALGWKVETYLPHRMEEGYGLSRDGVENCLRKYPAKVLLAVDCGSTAVETIQWLNERAVDVLVLDHHQVSSPEPKALGLVNPQRSDDKLSQMLCSVGLVFKLLHAIVKRGRELNFAEMATYDIRQYLDLVALGTVADLVPLRGENRVLVSQGLKALGETKRPGLIALKEVSQTSGNIGVYEVGYQLAPRLNAAGRLENASQALDLLRARSVAEALPLARELDVRNRERQEIEKGIAESAIATVRSQFQPERDYVIVLGEMMWHIGVVGIVASRVLREFYRPTIILGGSGEEWRGSGRSIEGFDLAAALRSCEDILVKHGGHAMAAGLTIVPLQVEAFRTRLNDLARKTISAEYLQPRLSLDAEITLGQVDMVFLDALQKLEPMGQGNAAVQLAARNLRMVGEPRRMGKEGQHVKFQATDGVSVRDVVWWGVGQAPMPKGVFDLAFAPQRNEYNGRTTIQLKLLDWREGKV